MKRKASSSKYELKVNVSPPRANTNHHPLVELDGSPKRSDSGSGSGSGSGSSSPSSSSSLSSSSSSDMSIESSCVSSEAEETTVSSPPPMVLVGCPRCLMYVMLSESNPKCPRCQSTVLLDFLKDESSNKKTD